MSTHAALALVETVVDKHADDLIELRRDLHAHPELSWNENRTTDLVATTSTRSAGGSPARGAPG